MNDGTVVTHAHPYQKTGDTQPFKSHHHTNAAFFFFDNIELLFYSASVCQLLFILNYPVTFRASGIPKYSPEYASSLRNRAPPAILIASSNK